MNAYRCLDISFWYKNKEYKLMPIDTSDYDDSIEIITYARHPDIIRGCIGNLILKSVRGLNIETYDDAPNQEDCYSDVMLNKIMIWSTNEDEAVAYKYIFLKN